MKNSMLIFLLRTIRFLIDHVSEYIYKWLCDGPNKRRALPTITEPLLLKSAVTLASDIRSQRTSSVNVVSVFIARIKSVNPLINAVVDERFSKALEEAAGIDSLIADSNDDELEKLASEKPFLGVPFTTKECIQVAGQSFTAGLVSRSEKQAKGVINAVAVQRMIDAGGIQLAVTNMSELGMWIESYNKVYGRTNNPYHLGRIPGGSSGGEGAIIASAGSVIGIGSDVGGSIRLPCFFNGIFGHKPSGGVVSNGGQMPNAYGLVHEEFLCTGPMCRYATDLIPMFKAILKPESLAKLDLDRPVDVKKLSLFYMSDNGGHFESSVHPELVEAQNKLLEAFEREFGLKGKRVQLRGFEDSFGVWTAKMKNEPLQPLFGESLGDGSGAINPLVELAKWACFKSSSHTLPAIFLALVEKFPIPAKRKLLNTFEELHNELDKLLGDSGVLIFPSHPTPAPYHGQPQLKMTNISYTAIFNVLGNPVSQVPLGLGTWGVPLGVQVVAAKYKDRNSLALALAAERLFGGWQCPS